MSTNEKLYAGVELGGTKCVAILASGPDDVRDIARIPTRQPDETFAAIGSVLNRWRVEHRPATLGIASFGPLDLEPGSPAFGQVVHTTKPGWHEADLNRLTGEEPCSIDTDVNGAALAEGLWGAARGLRSWCYVTIGTGVGVATIVQGKPISGLGHSEAGHMLVPRTDTGFAGACRYHGACIEGLVSGPALAARTGIDGSAIPDDHPVWNDVASEIAAMCHNLVLTTLPQAIIFGGGVASARATLLDTIRHQLVGSLAGYAHAHLVEADPAGYVLPAQLGDMAGPLGAIALAQSVATNTA
ncbi:ROK family protein [Alteriqipengyuania sp. 357]